MEPITLFIAGILFLIGLIIHDVKIFYKNAMHWWNGISHYGRTILVYKQFGIGYKELSPLSRFQICQLYRTHLKNKQS